jgi:Flp pilus assembly protein TadD/GTP-binding protein EngB required for normal cell division
MGILERIAGRFDELVGADGDSQRRAKEDVEVARTLSSEGNLDEAALAFGRAVDGDASNAEAWLGLGETLGRLGRFEPARDALRRALTLPLSSEQLPRAQAALGGLYALAGQTGKAIRELRKAAAALTNDVETSAALGRALVAAGEAEGSEWLVRAARLSDESGVNFLVEAAAATADATAAARLLREATTLAPGNPLARAALARHLIAVGNIVAALFEAAAATESAPADPVAWGAMREAHAASGDFRAALEDARHEANGGSPPPFQVWLTLALGTEDRTAIEEALTHGAPSDPGFAETRDLLQGVLSDAGLVRLARAAPRFESRRFVVRTLAPPAVPAGNAYALLSWAEALAARQVALLPLAVPLARALEAFDRPLLVAVMGEFNAGKSSFVNALAGAPIASVGVTPTTATINVLRHGAGGGRVIYHDGTARELASDKVGGFFSALGDEDAASIRQVEIFAPVEALRRVEVVDTPGLNSLREAHEKVARDFLVEADAIVWVFTAGQAAKASEREALLLARGAGKRVLGVVNKIDRATADEVAEILRHVQVQVGDLLERVVPFSARSALEARQRGDLEGCRSSGLLAVDAALEEGFFGRARELKRETALLALRRFIAEARAAIAMVPVAAGVSDQACDAVAGAEQELRSALAAERIALRARLDAAFRAAAVEVREFIRPRAWLFGEHTADPEDETFLRDVLDDGILAATAKTRATLVAGLPAVDSMPTLAVSDLLGAIDDAIERFRAYARGVIEGAAAVFFRVDLPRMRLDRAAIHGALGRWTPDPDEALLRPIEHAIERFVSRTRADLDERERTGEIALLMRREHILGPLDSLAEAVGALETDGGVERKP